MRVTALRSLLAAGALALGLVVSTGTGNADEVTRPTLTGFARLPALTFLPDSEESGSALVGTDTNGVTVPFADQPVQGFSGVVPNGDGSYLVLSDNGYAKKTNSADFLLRIHRITPHLDTGEVTVDGGFYLSDPDSRYPYPLTRPDRILTGADLDPESIWRGADGSYWIGDEFGPFLLHVDCHGRLLNAPVPLPGGVRAPENPAGDPATLGSSKGFEALTASPDGRYLYPLLEGTVTGDPAGNLRMYEFDLGTGAYTDRRWVYRLDKSNFSIGDAVTVDDDRLLVIERDNGQRDKAKVKKVYQVDRRDADGDGAMDKTLLVDLLDVANPEHIGGFGDTFRFPFQCIEDIALLDERTIALLDDNNLPITAGRTAGVPDDNEFITIRLPDSLHPDPRVLP
jgi:hypothetical protein